MWVRLLQLENFRNYRSAEVPLARGLNILFGENGEGKTSLVEVVEYLSAGRSMRTQQDKELISWGEEAALAHCFFCHEVETEKRIDLLIERGGRRTVKLDGVEKSQLAQWIGRLKTIAFGPNDVRLVSGDPALRRKFLNVEISKLRPGYLLDYSYYKRCVLQRNNLFKEAARRGIGGDRIAAWDRPLAEYGSRIILERRRFISLLAPAAKAIHRSLTGSSESLDLLYETNVISNSSLIDREAAIDENEVRSSFVRALEKTRHEEIRRGTTIIGPHRDDLKLGLTLNEKETAPRLDLRKFGSQGQQRTAALAVKLAVAQSIRDLTNDAPVVVLDDVCSELDSRRRAALLDQFEKFDQFIITTTDRELFQQNPDLDLTFHEVKGGRIFQG